MSLTAIASIFSILSPYITGFNGHLPRPGIGKRIAYICLAKGLFIGQSSSFVYTPYSHLKPELRFRPALHYGGIIQGTSTQAPTPPSFRPGLKIYGKRVSDFTSKSASQDNMAEAGEPISKRTCGTCNSVHKQRKRWY